MKQALIRRCNFGFPQIMRICQNALLPGEVDIIRD